MISIEMFCKREGKAPLSDIGTINMRRLTGMIVVITVRELSGTPKVRCAIKCNRAACGSECSEVFIVSRFPAISIRENDERREVVSLYQFVNWRQVVYLFANFII